MVRLRRHGALDFVGQRAHQLFERARIGRRALHVGNARGQALVNIVDAMGKIVIAALIARGVQRFLDLRRDLLKPRFNGGKLRRLPCRGTFAKFSRGGAARCSPRLWASSAT